MNKLPEFIIFENEKYYLEYKQIKDDNDILNGWWQAVYIKDNSLPPNVLIDNKFWEYLAVTEMTEAGMIEEMKRKLIGAKLI